MEGITRPFALWRLTQKGSNVWWRKGTRNDNNDKNTKGLIYIGGACSRTPCVLYKSPSPLCTKRKAPPVGGGWGVGPVEMEGVCRG